jgi:hypothetical protein
MAIVLLKNTKIKFALDIASTKFLKTLGHCLQCFPDFYGWCELKRLLGMISGCLLFCISALDYLDQSEW